MKAREANIQMLSGELHHMRITAQVPTHMPPPPQPAPSMSATNVTSHTTPNAPLPATGPARFRLVPLTQNEEAKGPSAMAHTSLHPIWEPSLVETLTPTTQGVPTAVGVIGSVEGHTIPPMLMSQLLKGVEMPVFNGRADHFQQWKWEFEDKCKLLLKVTPSRRK